jgi:hypothetical protein
METRVTLFRLYYIVFVLVVGMLKLDCSSHRPRAAPQLGSSPTHNAAVYHDLKREDVKHWGSPSKPDIGVKM